MTATVIRDSISSGLRLTTVSVEFPMIALEDVLADSNVARSSSVLERSDYAHTPYSSKRMLLTSGNWVSVLEGYRASPQASVDGLATDIAAALFKSVPEPRKEGEWHLPYVTPEDVDDAMVMAIKDAPLSGVDVGDEDSLYNTVMDLLAKVSAARCSTLGRTDWTIRQEVEQFLTLTEQQPHRRSYLEHQYMADYNHNGWKNPTLHGAPVGWIQYRKVYAWQEWKTRRIV